MSSKVIRSKKCVNKYLNLIFFKKKSIKNLNKLFQNLCSYQLNIYINQTKTVLNNFKSISYISTYKNK